MGAAPTPAFCSAHPWLPPSVREPSVRSCRVCPAISAPRSLPSASGGQCTVPLTPVLSGQLWPSSVRVSEQGPASARADPQGKGSADFLSIYVTLRCRKLSNSQSSTRVLNGSPIGAIAASFSETGLPVHVFFIAIFRVVYVLTTVVLVCRLPCLALWIIPSTVHLAARCVRVYG